MQTKIFHLLVCVFFVVTQGLLSPGIFSQTPTAPATGDGSKENPYEIADIDNLCWISESTDNLDKHYVQTANINAAETVTWYDSLGFVPIGTDTAKFTGAYNGQGFIIDSLHIDRPSAEHVGLFGNVQNADIKHIALTNVNITGNEYVGALSGLYNSGTLMSCYATGVVNGYRLVGGLLGSNRSGIIHSCYARVNVTRTSGTETLFGGFMGNNYLGKVINCYSTGWVKFGTVIQTDKGFCGSSSTWGNYDEPENYWDTETSGAGFTLGEATGKTSAEMKDQNTYKS